METSAFVGCKYVLRGHDMSVYMVAASSKHPGLRILGTSLSPKGLGLKGKGLRNKRIALMRP